MMDAIVTDRKYAFAEGGHLSLKPSEYFARQCWIGSSIVSRSEIELRHRIGANKMMWGWDYPHIESADWLSPRANLRALMRGVPEAELCALLAGNAMEAYRLEGEKLMPIARRIGPQIEEFLG